MDEGKARKNTRRNTKGNARRNGTTEDKLKDLDEMEKAAREAIAESQALLKELPSRRAALQNELLGEKFRASGRSFDEFVAFMTRGEIKGGGMDADAM